MLTLSPLHEAIGFLLVGFWLGYIGYRIEYHRAPFWLYIALIAKVFAGWGFGWLYASYYRYGDALIAYLTAQRLTHYLWETPADGIALLLRELSSEWNARGWEISLRDPYLYSYNCEENNPVNYHFYRLLVPLYVLAGGSFYGLQGLVALLGGLLSYAAYTRWQKLMRLPAGLWMPWFFLPSALLWTSGTLRDTLVLPLMLYGAAWFASVQEWKDAWAIPALFVIALLRMEALPLAVGVGLLYRWATRWTLVIATALAIILLGLYIGPWAYAYRSEALDPAFHPEVGTASTFILHYQPTFWGNLWGWIQGVIHGLLGPFPWHIRKPLILLYAIEVWLLAGLGVYYGWKGRWTIRTLILVGAGTFVIGVIAMAMPYWGTLARQRLYGLYFILLGIGSAFQMTLNEQENRLRESSLTFLRQSGDMGREQD